MFSSALRVLVPAALLAAVSASAQSPVTDQPVNNDPDLIRFAVLPDRTGGNRPGVYEDAIAKLNLLQPEFVISTGDLIDGYTLDPKVWTAQWDEFDALVKRLAMPFHYVAGNHDISNPLMAEAWRQRYGPPWSSFVYKNVLFLCLHTEDRPLGGLGEEQIAWAKRTLAEHAGVRWTMVFLHRPLWREENQAGFEQIRAALQGRKFTVFASHYHNYLKSSVDGMNAYIVATAGGSSQLRGPEFGELDHVAWVTVRPDGPVVANLELAGVFADDLVTEATVPPIRALRDGTWLHVAPVLAPTPEAARLEVSLEFRNPFDLPLRVRGSLNGAAGVDFLPRRIDQVVAPQKTVTLGAQLKAARGAVALHALNEAALELTFLGTYEPNGKALTLPTTRTLRFDWPHAVPAASQPVVLDGDLAEWPAAAFTAVTRPMHVTEDWDWHGAEDGRFRFAVQQRDGQVYLAVETTDDHVVTTDNPDVLQDRLMFVLRTSAGETAVRGVAGIHRADAVVRATQTGLAGEFLLPVPAGEKSFHLNIGWQDQDTPGSTKCATLWWRAPGEPDLGEFVLGPN